MTHWTDGMSPCVHCKALTRDKVDGVPMCNDCEDERICQFGHLHATPEGATGCQRKHDVYVTPPRATGEGARDGHTILSKSEQRTEGQSEFGDSKDDRRRPQTVAQRADTPPVAVSLDPHRLPDDDLAELRLTQRLREAIRNSARGGIKRALHDHGDIPRHATPAQLEAAAKRVLSAIWAVLRQHPDIKRVSGKFPHERLERAEKRCDDLQRLLNEKDAELARLRGEATVRQDDWELRARQMLWLGHGCGIAPLYGDDGELQCNNTTRHRPLDFKREDWDVLQAEILRLNLAAVRVEE